MQKRQNPPVKIKPETKVRLNRVDFIKKGITYDEIISTLLDFYDKNKTKRRNKKR